MPSSHSRNSPKAADRPTTRCARSCLPNLLGIITRYRSISCRRMRSPRPAPLPDAAEHRTLKLRDEVHRHAGPVYRSVDCAKQNPLGPGISWMLPNSRKYSHFPSIPQDRRDVQMAAIAFSLSLTKFTCGRRPGKDFLTFFCSIGRVRSRVRPVGAASVAAGPNARADRVPILFMHLESAMTQAGSPDPRNDRICITSSCPRQFVVATFSSSAPMPPTAASAR